MIHSKDYARFWRGHDYLPNPIVLDKQGAPDSSSGAPCFCVSTPLSTHTTHTPPPPPPPTPAKLLTRLKRGGDSGKGKGGGREIDGDSQPFFTPSPPLLPP